MATEEENISKVKIMDLDFSKIKFRPVKPKTKFRQLYYDLNALVIVFPKLAVPFSARTDQFGRADITISLGEEVVKKKKSEQIIGKLKELDLFIQDLAEKGNWLEGFSGLRYNPIVKQPNSNYPPRFNPKLDKNGGSTFYSDNNEVIEYSGNDITTFLTKGTKILPRIEFTGVYFMGTTWGLTYKFYDAKLYSVPTTELDEQETPSAEDHVEFLSSSESGGSDNEMGVEELEE